MNHKFISKSRHRANCETCALRQYCLPSVLSDQERLLLESSIEQGDALKKNQALFHEGEKFTHIHIIRSGAAKTISKSTNSISQITGIFFTSEIVGLESIGLESYQNSAIATESTFICSIRYDSLRMIGRLQPDLDELLFKRLAKKIRQSQEQIIANSKVTATERVALFLLFVSKRYQLLNQSEDQFRLPMSRLDVGDYLGLSKETVSRCLALLELEKIIEINNRNLKIINLSALNRKIGFPDLNDHPSSSQ